MSAVISRDFQEKKEKEKNCKIRQITACHVLKLTVMIITGNFGPSPEVL